MVKQVNNDFTQYELTDEEQRIAQSFSDLNEMYLRNLLSEGATGKLDITPSVDERLTGLQHEYMRGRLDILRELLLVSQDTKKEAVRSILDRNP